MQSSRLSCRHALVFFMLLSGAESSQTDSDLDTDGSMNPIRRVVNLLQAMQKKVTEEGKREEELFDKFMCYCKTGQSELTESISAAEAKITADTSALEEAEALLSQLTQELASHKEDLAEAKDAIAKATAMREKEAKIFAKESADYKANIGAMKSAIGAIEKGMSSSFLQSSGAATLRTLSINMEMSSMDRDVLAAFLSHSTVEGYVPQSGQITGILKQMQDSMEKNLADITATEESAIEDYKALVSAKSKEVAANQAAIESKLERKGQVSIEIVNLKEDLDDTTTALKEDKEFLANLGGNCDLKQKEWDERSKLRADELVALADTIKILNDDDALELFKKTLPAPAALLQTNVRESRRQLQQKALKDLDTGRGGGKHGTSDPRLDLIALALRGKSKGFDKVVKMIDSLVSLLGKEQTEDDAKKTYCEKQLDKSEDEEKALNERASDLEKEIEDARGTIATLKDEIEGLAAGIKKLDAEVADATATRKAENEEYKSTMAADKAAKDLLLMAKNRLAKFYTPKLYKPPAKVELSEAGRIEASMALVQISQHHAVHREAPAPPPETWDAYQKKGQEHGGVTAMMDLLLSDLEKDMTEAETEEKDSQKEYETLMADSAAKRAADSQALTAKGGAKADLEVEAQRMDQEKKATMKEAMLKGEFIVGLHQECDWLLQNYGMRKEARSGEVDALKNAKAVLSGADFSFIQASSPIGQARLRGRS